MTKNREFRPLAWLVVMTAALCCVVSAAVAALPPRIELDARMYTTDGAVIDETVVPGAGLRTGDELRLRVTAWSDGHLYVIALGSSGTAVLLHPFERGPVDSTQRGPLAAPVRSGEVVAVPADGGYLPLDDHTGQEMIVAFVAQEPVESLTRLMLRMEGLFNTPVAAREVLVSEGLEPAHILFGHTSRAVAIVPMPAAGSEQSMLTAPGRPVAGVVDSTLLAENLPTKGTAANDQQQGVLGNLGSRIAQFTNQPTHQSREASSTGSTTTRRIDAEHRTPAEPDVTPSAKGRSLLSRWFGADEKDEGNSPVVVVAEPDPDKMQKARTFALPQERPATQQELPPREFARVLAPIADATVETKTAVDKHSGLKRISDVPADAPANAASGRLVEPIAVEATAKPPGASRPTIFGTARAADSVQRTLSQLFTGGAAAKKDEVESAVASSALEPVRLNTTGNAPDTAPVEVVISRSADSAGRPGRWFSGLGALFSDAPSDVSSVDESRQAAKSSTASDPTEVRSSSATGQETTLVVQPSETLTTDSPVGADEQGSADTSSESAALGVLSTPGRKLPVVSSLERSRGVDVPVQPPGDGEGRIDVAVTQNVVRAEASDNESTEQAAVEPTREGGLLADLGSLLTNPFASAEDESPSTPLSRAQKPGRSSPQSVDTDNQPSIKRRLERDGKQVVVLGGLLAAQPGKIGNQEVLGESGSRIRRLLDEPEPQTAAVSPIAVETPASISAQSPAIVAMTSAPAKAVSQAISALAPVDVNSDSGVASSVVLVVTPNGSTSGVLIDRNGHLLTNWHSVNEFDEVVVMFKQSQGSMPSQHDAVRARVVAHSKFADLALLKVDTVPAGLVPAVVAAEVKMESGTPIHAISHAAGRGGNGQWRHDFATLDRVRRSSSWYSAQRVLHRADVIRAQMDPVRDVTGAPLFNNQLELIGLGAMVRADKGEIVGVSAAAIRAFLDDSS